MKYLSKRITMRPRRTPKNGAAGLSRYAYEGTVRILSTLTILLFSNLCLAVGWEEISKETVKAFNIDIKIELDDRNHCYKVLAELPLELMFGELGKRELWSVRYQKIEKKEKGWQLMPEGTQIELPTTQEGNHKKVGALCLSAEDLDFAHLSAVYGGPPGTPPMVVLINLSEFR